MTTTMAGDPHIARNVALHDRIADQYDRGHSKIFNDREQARLGSSLAAALSQFPRRQLRPRRDLLGPAPHPDYLAAVAEMGRVVRPGGIVYIDHEMDEGVYAPGSAYPGFLKRALKPDHGKWLRPINYHGKIRRLFDPKYANEGDIHVWPDDHIEWDRIRDRLGEAFEPVIDRTYLLYNGRYRPEVCDAHAGTLTDMRVMALRRRGTAD